jgi:hypothetical protein
MFRVKKCSKSFNSISLIQRILDMNQRKKLQKRRILRKRFKLLSKPVCKMMRKKNLAQWRPHCKFLMTTTECSKYRKSKLTI